LEAFLARGGAVVRAAVRLLVVVLALLAAGVGWAQESKGWRGAYLRDVTKEEA